MSRAVDGAEMEALEGRLAGKNGGYGLAVHGEVERLLVQSFCLFFFLTEALKDHYTPH